MIAGGSSRQRKAGSGDAMSIGVGLGAVDCASGDAAASADATRSERPPAFAEGSANGSGVGGAGAEGGTDGNDGADEPAAGLSTRSSLSRSGGASDARGARRACSRGSSRSSLRSPLGATASAASRLLGGATEAGYENVSGPDWPDAVPRGPVGAAGLSSTTDGGTLFFGGPAVGPLRSRSTATQSTSALAVATIGTAQRNARVRHTGRVAAAGAVRAIEASIA
jgi:hypothetical protein